MVSELESIFVRLLLGGCLDAAGRGRYDEIEHLAEAILAWCKEPGVTDAAREEFETSCVRDGTSSEPCLDCDECRYWAPGSCRKDGIP